MEELSMIRAMKNPKAPPPDEQERIREALRRLLADTDGNQSELSKRLKISQTHISKTTRAEHPEMIGYRTAEKIAKALGMSLDELRLGRTATSATALRYRDLPAWASAVAEARRLYGDQLPAYAWKRASGLCAPRDARLNAITVFNLARSYWETMSDADRAEATRRQAESEMAREDEEALVVAPAKPSRGDAPPAGVVARKN